MPNKMNFSATTQSPAAPWDLHLFHLLPTARSNTGHPPTLRKPTPQRRELQTLHPRAPPAPGVNAKPGMARYLRPFHWPCYIRRSLLATGHVPQQCGDAPAPGRGVASLAPQLRCASALTALHFSLLFTMPLLWPVPWQQPLAVASQRNYRRAPRRLGLPI